ncbi:MAG: thioredoxin family protein [Cyanobacteria bacterium P01_A01_bin.123]
MVKTASTMLPLGTPAPDFQLPDVVSGKMITLADFAGKQALLIMFICQHCPFVKHVQVELANLGQDYVPKGIGVLAISANSVKTHPADSPENLKAMAVELGFNFPYCYDESQETAKQYTAACTPDFFLFDSTLKLAYRGQLDESRPGNGKPVTGQDLRAAMDGLLAGDSLDPNQVPSIGCNIKWTPGNEPAYFG